MAEDGTLGGLGLRSPLVNLDCTRQVPVLWEPCGALPPALFCVPRPAHQLLTYWLPSRVGRWEEVEGVGRGKPLVCLLCSSCPAGVPPAGPAPSPRSRLGGSPFAASQMGGSSFL